MLDEFRDLDLWPVNRPAWLAWAMLSGSRPVGFGLGMIPLSEIWAWFQLKGRPVNPLLIEKIQVIDGAFVSAESDRQKSKRERDQTRARANRPAPAKRRH